MVEQKGVNVGLYSVIELKSVNVGLCKKLLIYYAEAKKEAYSPPCLTIFLCGLSWAAPAEFFQSKPSV